MSKEFDLTVTEVKNKIRIYRTTYGQELKKMGATEGFRPKLSWFSALHKAFKSGKVKSFVKTPKRAKLETNNPRTIAVEMQDDFETTYEEEEMPVEQWKLATSKHKLAEDEHLLLVEPYEEGEEEFDEGEEMYQEALVEDKSFTEQHTSNVETSRASGFSVSHLLTSNELFLKSLLETFDKLPEDKNMKARIKIQEVLYNIMYE